MLFASIIRDADKLKKDCVETISFITVLLYAKNRINFPFAAYFISKIYERLVLI